MPLNTSQLLFPHLVAAKRKRSEAVLDLGNSDDLQPSKIRRIDTSRPEETAAERIAICEDGVQWAAGAAGSRTPGKRRPSFSDVFSPNKRVQFNMKPMPPTPGRGGLAPRGILKTPLKATPHKAQERGGIGSPVLTPLKAAPCQLTPLRRSYDRKVLTVLNYLILI